ncbi:MAG: DUF4163 domain-containing protein [Tahibacter sp.]
MQRLAPIWLTGCLLLSACDQPPPPPDAPASRVTPAAASSAATMPDRGDGYRIEIRFPQLSVDDAALADALRAFAARARRDFLTNLAQRRDSADTQRPEWILHLEFVKRAESEDWLSIVAKGDVYTGGAHGNPLLASFNLHRPTRRLLGVGDLFQNADSGLRALSAFARQSLTAKLRPGGHDADAALRRVVDGTEPRIENFTEFAIADRADGIVLLFPPYQIAAYAEGVHELAVPLRVFGASLKPELRDSFAPARR